MVKKELEGRQIHLRKSQTKFPSEDLTFNVIRCSTFGQGYLNRSIILLLNCLGVSDDYFISKQRQAKQLVDLDSVRDRLNIALQLYNRSKGRKAQTEVSGSNPESAS